MTIGFKIGSTTLVKPTVASTLQVIGSFANVTPSPRNILIVGESTEGAPASVVDLKDNWYSDLSNVRAEYGEGPIVDACVQLFTTQPDKFFRGSVGRVYIAKTNQSTASVRALADGYGTLSSSRYGEVGNFIKSQVIDGEIEVLPSVSYSFIPVAANHEMDIAVNGVQVANNVSLRCDSTNFDADIIVLDAPASLSVDASLLGLATADDVVSVSVSGGVISIENEDGFTSVPSKGSTLLIQDGSNYAGISGQNVGSYIVESADTSVIVARKLVSLDDTLVPISYVAPVAVASAPFVADDILFYSKIDMNVDTSIDGGASLEVAIDAGDKVASVALFNDNPLYALSSSSANISSIKSEVVGTILRVTLIDSVWTTRPTVGSLVEIQDGSKLQGVSKKNVGLWLVESVGTNYINLSSPLGLTGEAVSTVFLAGDNDVFSFHNVNTSTDVKAKVITSSQERTVIFDAQNTLEGTEFPDSDIGGVVVFSLSYNGTAATATASIDGKRRLKISLDGVETTSIQLGKFNTLKQLSDFVNTITGMKSSVSRAYAQYPTTILDEVQDIGILALHSGHEGNVGRVKSDYWMFSQAFESSTINFIEGSSVYKRGLPSVDSSAVFFAGGGLGATSNQDVMDALEDSIYLPVRMVVPLFSRDALKDIEDGLTHEDSSYTIESIVSLASSHAKTASNDRNRKERIALVSHYGDYEDSKDLVRSIGNHLCSGLAFQQIRSVNSKGEVQWMLPWVFQCMVAAGRAQALLGMPMLRKAFNISAVRHIGDLSLYTDGNLNEQFNWQDLDQTEDAISAGLIVLGEQSGKNGIVQLSPDVSSISEFNSSTAFYYERHNVIFIAHELLQTCRDTLENFIGLRKSDVSIEAVRSALDSVLSGIFVTGGSVQKYVIDSIDDLGNGYLVKLRFKPVEGLEFIGLDVSVVREL